MVSFFNPEANSIDLEERAINPDGSGEGFIFFTFDQQLIVKNINKSKVKAFLKLFPFYFCTIISGGRCFIVRIFGVFKL